MPQNDPSEDVDSYLEAVRRALDASAGGTDVPTNTNKDYESDAREKEFSPEEEIKYQFRDKLGTAPEPFNLDKSRPDSYRIDGTLKGRGHLGPIKTPSGKTMTEKSIGVDSKLIPALVPTLTPAEIKLLANDQKPTKEIVKKAKAYSDMRAKRGMEPFANEQGYVVGGKIKGPAPANPMKDNVTIKAQAGEYIVPKKVVDVLGADYFDNVTKLITGKKPMPKVKGQTFTPDSNSNSPHFQTGGKVGAEGQTGNGWQPPDALPGTFGDPSNFDDSWQPKQQAGGPLFGYDSKGNRWSPYDGMEEYWQKYYDNPRNHYAGNWAGNPDDMVQVNRGNRGGSGMAGPNDMRDELSRRRQGRGGGDRFRGPVFNQRSNLSDRPAGGYPLVQGYPQGSAPWDYGQNPSGVWGNAGNYNISGESHKAGQDAMAFASNTWGQGIVHDPEVGSWRNENRPIAGQHVVENNPRFALGKHAWNQSQRIGRAMWENMGFFRGPQPHMGGRRPVMRMPNPQFKMPVQQTPSVSAPPQVGPSGWWGGPMPVHKGRATPL